MSEGYCRLLFTLAGMDSFDCWWTGSDPSLDGRKPSEVVAVDQRRVCARAEYLTDDRALSEAKEEK